MVRMRNLDEQSVAVRDRCPRASYLRAAASERLAVTRSPSLPNCFLDARRRPAPVNLSLSLHSADRTLNTAQPHVFDAG